MQSIAKRGTVFIAWDDREDEPGFYFGYWDGGGDGPGNGFLGQMPETPSIEVALAWGHARAYRIRIRPSWDPAHYYSAGTERVPTLPELTRPE